MTQEEKIKDLEERIAVMQATDSALCADLEHWKKVAAGLKGHNKKLAERVEHYKQLDLEGDELYEKRIAEIEELKLTVNAKSNTITGLESQVRKMSEVLKEKDERIEELKSDVVVAEANLEYYKNMPWYKRIFAKM